MTIVVDRTRECLALYPPEVVAKHVRAITAVTLAVVHKTSVSQLGPDNPHPIPDAGLDAVGLCRTFRDNPSPPPVGLGTAGWIPYGALITARGVVEQCAPLAVETYHARRWNPSSFAIALVGDFDAATPSPAMWRAAVNALASLAILNGGLDIHGHTELPAASGDPNKQCPGRHLSMRALEIEVANSLPYGWQRLSAYEVRDRMLSDGWVVDVPAL